MFTSSLKVQDYLRIDPGIFTYDSLEFHYGIKTVCHPEKPLAILNYSQLNSPKTHPIVRECRGLVLNIETHEIVARAFPRFFNWGEVQSESDDFDFSNCFAESKEDGSLVLIYWFNGQWCANTRGSFADGKINDQPYTWTDGICAAIGIRDLTDLNERCQKHLCYVCEFCSRWNKVVREYDKPQMFLLTVFHGHTELSAEVTDMVCPQGFVRPSRCEFRSIDEVQQCLKERSEKDPTFEGFVLRDWANRRWKVKSPTYLALHRLKGDGGNMYLPKNLLPFIMSGEKDELLTYFPEVEKTLDEVEKKVNEARDQMLDVWRKLLSTLNPFCGLHFDHFVSLNKKGVGNQSVPSKVGNHESNVLADLVSCHQPGGSYPLPPMWPLPGRSFIQHHLHISEKSLVHSNPESVFPSASRMTL